MDEFAEPLPSFLVFPQFVSTEDAVGSEVIRKFAFTVF